MQAAAAGGCNGGGRSKVSSEKSEGGELGCGWEEDGGDFGDDAGDAEIDSPSTAAAAAGCADDDDDDDDDGAAADADEVNAAGTAGSIASRGVGCDELLLLLLLLMLLLLSRSSATASAAAAGATAE